MQTRLPLAAAGLTVAAVQGKSPTKSNEGQESAAERCLEDAGEGLVCDASCWQLKDMSTQSQLMPLAGMACSSLRHMHMSAERHLPVHAALSAPCQHSEQPVESIWCCRPAHARCAPA